PFTIRPYRRFPVCCPVTYHAGLSERHGIVWNLSLNGWRLLGDLPLRVGQTCSLFVHFSNPKCAFVVAGIVRWMRGEEYGIETLVANGTTQARLATTSDNEDGKVFSLFRECHSPQTRNHVHRTDHSAGALRDDQGPDCGEAKLIHYS